LGPENSHYGGSAKKASALKLLVISWIIRSHHFTIISNNDQKSNKHKKNDSGTDPKASHASKRLVPHLRRHLPILRQHPWRKRPRHPQPSPRVHEEKDQPPRPRLVKRCLLPGLSLQVGRLDGLLRHLLRKRHRPQQTISISNILSPGHRMRPHRSLPLNPQHVLLDPRLIRQPITKRQISTRTHLHGRFLQLLPHLT